jgi:hypothetical protein
MHPEQGYLIGMVQLKIHQDALLLSGDKDFCTANGNTGGNKVATFMATRSPTARQRSDNVIGTS